MISIIIPVFNEEANLSWHHKKITEYLATLPYQFEILYVNDGSRDNSLAVLKSIAAQDSHARYISFSRNFGKEAATTAGLRACRGDAAIMIDADGQHPIELIQEFIDQMAGGRAGHHRCAPGQRQSKALSSALDRDSSIRPWPPLVAPTSQ